MLRSASILASNLLLSGVMQKLILGLSFVLLMGCDSYTVELDPNWEEDSSGTNINDPSVEEPGTTDPTDTEPPVIELTFDDESEPDDADTSSPILAQTTSVRPWAPFALTNGAWNVARPVKPGSEAATRNFLKEPTRISWSVQEAAGNMRTIASGDVLQ